MVGDSKNRLVIYKVSRISTIFVSVLCFSLMIKQTHCLVDKVLQYVR